MSFAHLKVEKGPYPATRVLPELSGTTCRCQGCNDRFPIVVLRALIVHQDIVESMAQQVVVRNFKLLEELESLRRAQIDMSISMGLVNSGDIFLWAVFSVHPAPFRWAVIRAACDSGR